MTRHTAFLSFCLLALVSWMHAVEPSPSPSFAPAPPGYDPEWDWLQLTSGEWLKGDVKSYYNDKLEFDSDKLKILTIKKKDIQQLITGNNMSVNIGKRQPLIGRLHFKDQELNIIRGEHKQSVRLEEVVSMTSSAEKELDRWSTKISMGANIRAGNTDQIAYNANINFERRTALTRFSFDYLGNLNETNGFETANNHRADSYFDFYISRRWFYRLINLEYFRDPFQNVEHRLTASTSLGYTMVDTPNTEWDVLLGPGYQYNSLQKTSGSEGVGKFALIAGTNLQWEINSRQDFRASYQSTLTDTGSGGWIQNLTLQLENEIAEDFDFDITFIWDRIGNPITGSDGTTPEPDDFRLLFSVGYRL